ncbi:hypothetical protein A2U01_0112699 [Trifolium medium]|uniref:Uncharacterized protein n=1 Tax=Trifolium medium TaxID=97028 RepID=A0A392VXJ8_9FABA|nr:hypothetical protein [Trifolium medium]
MIIKGGTVNENVIKEGNNKPTQKL